MKANVLMTAAFLVSLIPTLATANPTPGPINPNTVPRDISLASRVSGKITIAGAMNSCAGIKVELTNSGNFPPIFKSTGKVTQVSQRECSYEIVIPSQAKGQSATVNVISPIGTYFVPGNWKNSVKLPTTGNLENLNGMIKLIG